jgi:hypothetical protein
MEQGNLHRNAKEKLKQRPCEVNTDRLCRGGSNRSSDEISVMEKE